MTNSPFTRLKNAVPTLQSKWWTALLVASLMANLLVAGLVAGRLMGGHGMRGKMQQSFIQIIPRQFLEALPQSRRHELMQALRGNRDDFSSMQKNSAAAALELATALESPTYDTASVKAVIDKFATGRESLSMKAGDVVLQIIEKLSPDERAQLARSIRERNAQDWKKN